MSTLLLSLLSVVVAFSSGRPAQAQHLRMTDLHMSPKTIEIRWHVPPPPCSAPSGGGGPDVACVGWSSTLDRSPGSLSNTTANPVRDGDDYVYTDTTWGFNTRYTYSVGMSYTTYHYIPPQGNTPGQWAGSTSTGSANIYVTVRRVPASVNQTADTRLDLRYGDPTLKDFKFNDRTFRGGLFAGFNGDNSKVSRTYLKFTNLLGPIVAGEKLWPYGGLTAYCTRLAQTGSVSLMCRTGLSDTWDASTLSWSNAPLPKTTGGTAVSISWDKTNLFGAPGDPYSPPSATDPTGKWISFKYLPDIEDALGSNLTTLTSLVMSPSEQSSYNGAPDTTSGGWAYFAKTGYSEPNQPVDETDLTAYLLYAFGGYGTHYDNEGNPTDGDSGGGGGPGGGDEGFAVKKSKGSGKAPGSGAPKTNLQPSKPAGAKP